MILARGKREWEVIFDSVASPILVTDENGVIRRCNRAAAQATGLYHAAILLPDRHALAVKVAQLEAIFGWVGGRMASHYTRSADRARLAREAIGKLVNETATSIPSPKEKVRAPGRKR